MPFLLFKKWFCQTNWDRLVLVASVLLISALYISIPFESLLRQPFWDLAVYHENFESGYPERKLHQLNSQGDPVESLVHEHLWLALIIWGRDILGSYGASFTAVSYISCVILLTVMVRVIGWPISMMMLFHPWMTGLLMSQIRSALAIALVYVAWRWQDLLLIGPKEPGLLRLPSDGTPPGVIGRPSWSWIPRMSILVAACYIHTAMVLLVTCIFASHAFSKVGYARPIIASVFMWIFIALVTLTITMGREGILGSVGDRRVDYEESHLAISDAMIWTPLLVLFLVLPHHYIRKSECVFPVICLAVFLSSAWFSLPSSRIFVVSMPLFMGLILCFDGYMRTALLAWIFLTSCLYLRSHYELF